MRNILHRMFYFKRKTWEKKLLINVCKHFCADSHWRFYTDLYSFKKFIFTSLVKSKITLNMIRSFININILFVPFYFILTIFLHFRYAYFDSNMQFDTRNYLCETFSGYFDWCDKTISKWKYVLMKHFYETLEHFSVQYFSKNSTNWI